MIDLTSLKYKMSNIFCEICLNIKDVKVIKQRMCVINRVSQEEREGEEKREEERDRDREKRERETDRRRDRQDK